MRPALPKLALLTVALVPILGSAAVAQAPAPDAPLPIDAGVVTGTLPNGLRYFVRANGEPEGRAELRLAVNAGSVLEDDDQRGLAHVLEHMAFNGTTHFERQELVDYLETVGMRFGPDVNAYTSYDETVYMLTLPTDTPGVLETGFQILEDWASGIVLDSVEIEKERGVVLEEWRLGQGAGSRMHREQNPVLMGDSRYAERDPIGTRESLTSFSHEALRRFYRDWYRPSLMAVVAVGDFDPVEVQALIERHFGHLENPADARPRPEYPVPAHEETLVSVATDPEASGSSVSLYLKRPPRQWTTAGAFRAWIVESLASNMLVNRLSESMQRPGSPFVDVSSFHGRFIRPLSAHVLGVRVPDSGIERGLEAVLIETERAARHGFTATELERDKRELLRYAEQQYLERDRTSSGAFAAEYVANFLYGGTPLSAETEYELYASLLEDITVEEVDSAARPWMRPQNRVVLVRAPERGDLVVPEPERLQEIVRAVERLELVAYADSLGATQLMPHRPVAGRVTAEREHPAVGVIEWTLSNGARVLLKPTDFRQEEILFAARSPGGSSLVADHDHVAALTATAVVQAGGIGELSATELRKLLTGTVAGVGADIGELHEGLAGAASPRDLETLLQLAHLKFTAPRVDSAAFEAYREQARAALESRGARPEDVFADTLRVVLAQHHPRVRPPSVAIFDSLSLERSFEIYRERFADASDFTFYLAGNFEPESVRPLVEQYLASLPALDRDERPRDLGIRPPRGVVRKTVRRGLEPKTLTRIVFTGDFDYRRENLQAISSLADVLRIRLRDVLREDLSGTYGVDVRAQASGEPSPGYQISIGFGADPERLDELVGVVFQEIDRLQREGPLESEVQKVREAQLRARELDLRRNDFWINQIMFHDRNGWELAEILAAPDRIRRVDAATIRSAASVYLDPENYVQVSLLPERETGLGSGGPEPDRE